MVCSLLAALRCWRSGTAPAGIVPPALTNSGRHLPSLSISIFTPEWLSGTLHPHLRTSNFLLTSSQRLLQLGTESSTLWALLLRSRYPGWFPLCLTRVSVLCSFIFPLIPKFWVVRQPKALPGWLLAFLLSIAVGFCGLWCITKRFTLSPEWVSKSFCGSIAAL